MAAPTTVTDFLSLVRKSGLLDEKRFSSLFPDGADLPDEPQACANVLVRDGLLTAFQARQLLAGKFRGFVLGAYKILRPIGQGGMGTVFLAEHSSLKRMVALKVLSADKAKDQLGIERFYREARAAAALDHPNIVRLHDVSQGAGAHFLVMEYVEGKDLQSLMADTGPLHFAQACHYIAQAAAGLQHAHEKGFVHRDIKPANLILAKDGTVKILDMGLARSFQDESDNLTGSLGDEPETFGTADYISPEQALGQKVDERSDIYSLGATMFALITGHPPFKGTTAQILMQHQMAEVPRLSKKLKVAVPAALYDVLAQMMAKKKGERYPSASDVIDALSPWLPATPSGNVVQDPLSTQDLRSAGVTKKTTNVRGRARESGDNRRKKLLIAGGAVGVVAIVGILIAVLGPSSNNLRSLPPQTGSPPSSSPAPQVTPQQPLNWKNHQAIAIDQYGTATTDQPLFYGKSSERYSFPNWGEREVFGVPFRLTSPQGGKVRNVLLLRGSIQSGGQSQDAPDSISLPVNRTAAAIHFLGGVAAWALPYRPGNAPEEDLLGKNAMTVRLNYMDGQKEDHQLRNGEEIVDWIRINDVPGSKLAFLDDYGHQVRYLSVVPMRAEVISTIDLVKGEVPEISPVVLAVTIELRAAKPDPKGSK
jgi:serine/threonine protein kinase